MKVPLILLFVSTCLVIWDINGLLGIVDEKEPIVHYTFTVKETAIQVKTKTDTFMADGDETYLSCKKDTRANITLPTGIEENFNAFSIAIKFRAATNNRSQTLFQSCEKHLDIDITLNGFGIIEFSWKPFGDVRYKAVQGGDFTEVGAKTWQTVIAVYDGTGSTKTSSLFLNGNLIAKADLIFGNGQQLVARKRNSTRPVFSYDYYKEKQTCKYILVGWSYKKPHFQHSIYRGIDKLPGNYFYGDIADLKIFNYAVNVSKDIELPGKTKCKDLYHNQTKCKKWAADGECNKNPGWMMKNCQKSCNVCYTDEDMKTINYDLEETTLKNKLFSLYDKDLRPVKNLSDPVNVTFQLAVRQLHDLDEVNHLMKIYGNALMMWQDPRLKWDPSLHGGITEVRLPSNKLWIPDLAVYNSNYRFGTLFIKNIADTVTVLSSGQAFIFPASRFVSNCQMDHSKFPFDQQNCMMEFGSWLYWADKLDLELRSNKNKQNISDDAAMHHKWKITSFYGEVKRTSWSDSGSVSIIYSFTFQRRSANYVHLCITPAVTASFLIPFLFCFPINSRDGTTLAIGLILIFTIMLSSLMAIFWTYGSMPLLLEYYAGNIIMTVIVWILSKLIGIMYNNHPRSAPPLCLARATENLCLLKIMMIKPVDKKTNAGGRNDDDEDKSELIDQIDHSDTWRCVAMLFKRLFFICFLCVCIFLALAYVTPY